MSRTRTATAAIATMLVAVAWRVAADTKADGQVGADGTLSPTRAIVASVGSPTVRELLEDILARNPRLAAAQAAAEAAAARAPQEAALPDPTAGLTVFLQTPETRVGPQQATVSLAQRFPWFGTLRLREKAAVLEAAASIARVEAIRLQLVTEARSLVHELSFLAREAQVVREDRDTLAHFEELARARYATGVGLGQTVVKIQAEITRDDARLVRIARRRAELVADLNALRDRPEEVPVRLAGSRPARLDVDPDGLREIAMAARPELAAARARVGAADLRVELARARYRPDVTAGLAYTVVGPRDDAAGRRSPPEDDGKDVVGLTASVNLPVWREKLAAGVEEAASLMLAAESSFRDAVTAIDRELGDLANRIPLLREELDLYERVLLPQADEALESALAGYSAGTHDALDLLDAERVLLEVRIATARTEADLAIAIARLEGAVARPVANGETS